MSRIFILTHHSTWRNIFHIFSLPFNDLIKFTEFQVRSEMLNGTYMQATVENEWLFESCSRHLRIFVDFDKEFL